MPNPTNIEDRLVIVADQMVALIGADSYFAAAGAAPAVPVLTERKGDINAMVTAALSKLGLCVVIVAADAGELTTKGTTLVMRVRLVAQISENYLFNNSATGLKKPALAATVRAMKAVHRKPNGLDAAGARHVDGINEFALPDDQPFRLVPDKTFITYHVTAYTTVEL